jgi:hypothetical protein
MPIVNGKLVLDPRISKKWLHGPKVVNKCKVEDPNACLSEYLEQVAFVKWMRAKNLRFSAIPMNTWTTYSQQNKNIAQGVNRGVPDLVVIVNKELVWIEMKKLDKKSKTGKGMGGLSIEQKEWIEALNNCENCSAHVAYGSLHAQQIILDIEAKMV